MRRRSGRGRCSRSMWRRSIRYWRRIAAAAWPIYLGPREVWRRTGNQDSGQREVFVQDPDGYLLMLANAIGTRQVTSAR